MKRYPSSQDPNSDGIGQQNAIKLLTFHLELKRAVCHGILESAAATFLLLFAVQVFQTSPSVKAMVVAAAPAGLLISPLVVSVVRKLGWSPAKGIAFLGRISCLGFLLSASLPNLWVFVAGAAVGVMGATASIPLLTQIYQNNYPSEERGGLFSKSVMVKVLAAVIFSWAGGELLDYSLDAYRILLLVFALAAGLGSYLASRFPSEPLHDSTSAHPLRGFHHLKSDPLFRWIQISWFFLGTGTLMMIPLQVELLGNPARGEEMSPLMIALLISIIPSLSQFSFAQLWGRLFDRINFFVLRIILNLLFAAWVVCFFLIGGMQGFVLGGVFFGVASAGGSIAWSLWVTKLAAPGLVAEYMGVHTFLTGARSVVIPFITFSLISWLPMSALAWGSIGLLLTGSLMLVPEARTLMRRRPGSPLNSGPTGVQE